MRIKALFAVALLLSAPSWADEKLDKEMGKAFKDISKGNAEKAIQRMEKYARKNPSGDSYISLAEIQQRIGTIDGGGIEAAAQSASMAARVAKGPARAHALAVLTSYDLRRGTGADALKHATEAVSIQENAETLAALARAQVRVQNLEGGLATAEKAVAKGSRSGAAHVAHGAALLALSRSGSAVEALQKAVAASPKSTSAHIGLALALSSKGEHAKAIAAARKATELNPESGEALAALGLVLMEQSPGDGAALSAAIGEAVTGKHINDRSVFTLEVVGRIFDARGDFQLATKAYDEATKIDPGYVPTQVALIRQRIRQQDLAAALKASQALVAAAPHSALAHDQLGRCLLRTNKFAEALTALEKAVQLAPGLAEAHAHLGTAYQYNRRRLDALHSYEKAVDLDPSKQSYRISYGLLLGLNGRHADGINQIEPIVADKSYDKADAYTNLGWLYRNAKPKRARDSVRSYMKALEIDPENADAALGMGWAYTYVRPRVWEKAIAAFEHAIELNAAFAGEAHSGIAWCYFFQQDIESAKRHAQEAASHGKRDRRLVANINRVEDEQESAASIMAYNQLVEGMNYEQVQGVIGRPGEEIARDGNEVTYQWENTDETFVLVVLEDDKLVDMVHTGLEGEEYEEGEGEEGAVPEIPEDPKSADGEGESQGI